MESSLKACALGLVAALAVTACSQSTNSSSSTSTESSAAAATAAATEVPTAAATSPGGTPGAMHMAAAGGAAAGAKVYQTNCSSCHQANGEGAPGVFPPLAANPTVTGDASKVIHIVKYGLSGKIAVAGKDYNGMMPAWGAQLSNGDIADAITYIRASWGNKASAVTTAQVAAVSK
ncbi:MAG TPA: cytochrome c [Candidatus Baltobacteraceae bacterium]|nr:cytochrome c [Candidatus Baltobacteraceae bacterium]